MSETEGEDEGHPSQHDTILRSLLYVLDAFIFTLRDVAIIADKASRGGFVLESREAELVRSAKEGVRYIQNAANNTTALVTNVRLKLEQKEYNTVTFLISDSVQSFRAQKFYPLSVAKLSMPLSEALRSTLSKMYIGIPASLAVNDVLELILRRNRFIAENHKHPNRLIRKRPYFLNTKPSEVRESSASKLREALTVDKAVPDRQDIAPIYFDIKDGRVVPRPEFSAAEPLDAANISAARAVLTEDAQRLIEEVEGTNFDRRVIAALKRLHQSLASETNIIRVAFNNATTIRMIRAVANDTDDALIANLLAFTDQVDDLGAQFPDYQRFVSQTQMARVEPSQIVDVVNRLPALTEELRAASEIVDPGVAEAIADMHSQVIVASPDDKRTGFAVIKTLVNLSNRLWKLSLEQLNGDAAKAVGKFASGVVEDVGKNLRRDTANLATALIYGVLATTIGSILGAIGLIDGLGWVVMVQEFLRRRQTDLMK